MGEELIMGLSLQHMSLKAQTWVDWGVQIEKDASDDEP